MLAPLLLPYQADRRAILSVADINAVATGRKLNKADDQTIQPMLKRWRAAPERCPAQISNRDRDRGGLGNDVGESVGISRRIWAAAQDGNG